jgi:hypothetical protein
VLRRAARIFRFARPNEDQRRELLARQLDGTVVNGSELDDLVRLTGPLNGRAYGWTFSDIRQRFVVQAVLDSLDRGPLRGDRLVALASDFVPTPPFGDLDG